MIWPILGILLICFVCSMMSKSSNQEAREAEIHAEQQQRFQQQADAEARAQKARRIEAFAELLKEEFPHLGDKITFSAVAGFEDAFQAAASHDFVRVRRKALNKAKFKTQKDAEDAYNYMLRQAIDDFPEHILRGLAEDKDFVGKVVRAFDASRVRAG